MHYVTVNNFKEFLQGKINTICELFQSMELAKLKQVQIDETRRQEAAQKIAEQNKSFSEETEKKLQEKLSGAEENKNEQIKALQERLKDHVSLK